MKTRRFEAAPGFLHIFQRPTTVQEALLTAKEL